MSVVVPQAKLVAQAKAAIRLGAHVTFRPNPNIRGAGWIVSIEDQPIGTLGYRNMMDVSDFKAYLAQQSDTNAAIEEMAKAAKNAGTAAASMSEAMAEVSKVFENVNVKAVGNTVTFTSKKK